ncbi:nucleotide disphospho-sugar-binding domain-containing protein [Actinopolymorpha alba]|uniref:nucleotide disphospho-sugar-binding domain-containing protein n=1 Tax=Actinopolymorpha alba TaxID=533267 RepID=UPI00039CE3F2|nr:nucleotide disphospho-sugar-binding domain-containing protein [Actinopolymorpha alba]
MSRFLFVVPPLAGHVNPTVGVAARLVELGHEVAWAGSPEVVRQLVGPDALVFACALPPLDGTHAGRPPDLRGVAALRFLWERFLIPLGDAMVPGVRAAVDAFAPDVLVVDQQALAGAAVGAALGIPWATSATTSAELAGPLADMPKVGSWLAALLAEFGARHGVPAGHDPRFSPHLVLAFSTRELVGEIRLEALGAGPSLPGVLRFVGPSIAPRPEADDGEFPWSWLASPCGSGPGRASPVRAHPQCGSGPGRASPFRAHPHPDPVILVTLGTVNADVGVRFLDACLRALRERPGLRAVVVDPTGGVDGAPPNVLLVRRVPQLALLPHVEAVVCHAGHNTVCESLFHGLPLVVAPIRDDQPVIAQQVVDAGAGIRLRFGRATSDHLGRAIDEVLGQPGYRVGARRVRESFRTAGGASAAADHLVALARRGSDRKPNPVCF